MLLCTLAPLALLATLVSASEVTRAYNSSGTLHLGDWSGDGLGTCHAGNCWNASIGPVRNASGVPQLALLNHGKPIAAQEFSFWEVASCYRNTKLGDGYGVLISEKGRCLSLPRMPESTTDLVPFTAAECSWADDASQMPQIWRQMNIGESVRYFGFFGEKAYNPNVQNTLYHYSNTSDKNALVGMELLPEQYPATYWLWFNPNN